MDAAQDGQSAPAFDQSKPVYLLLQTTDNTGYPNGTVKLLTTTVDEDGTIHFTLEKDTTGTTGAAIALAQPKDATGEMCIRDSLSTAPSQLRRMASPFPLVPRCLTALR